MERKTVDSSFDGNVVFELYPDIHIDNRGWFAEVLRYSNKHIDIKQINRSCSKPGTIRGCHAQRGPFCQAKLVEALNTDIVDVITDARPTSKTFGQSKMYLLSIAAQNKLFVPRGFLHAFIVPLTGADSKRSSTALFNYYCDNTYDKASEVCVRPQDVIQPLFEQLSRHEYDMIDFATLSTTLLGEYDLSEYHMNDKDKNGMPLDEFLANVKAEFKETGKLWYE